MTPRISVGDSIKEILRRKVFAAEEQRNSIYDDSIYSFSDIIMFTEKDIYSLSTDFSRLTQANERINFGMRRTKMMKELLDWVQEFYCISEYPIIVEMNEIIFIKQLDTSMYRSEIRKKIIN